MTANLNVFVPLIIVDKSLATNLAQVPDLTGLPRSWLLR